MTSRTAPARPPHSSAEQGQEEEPKPRRPGKATGPRRGIPRLWPRSLPIPNPSPRRAVRSQAAE